VPGVGLSAWDCPPTANASIGISESLRLRLIACPRVPVGRLSKQRTITSP